MFTKKIGFSYTKLLVIVALSLACSAGCSYETIKDISETTNDATDHVDEGQYSVDQVDRIDSR